MTPRQARTERRTAERKAKKRESKKAKLEAAAAPEHSSPTSGGFVSHDRALAKIFPPDMVADAIAFREKVLADLDAKPAPKSSKRAEINRANSQHSTGPRSPQGKLASSRNSLKHGLASGQMIIPGEDTAAFEALLHDLLEEHQPANPTEELLINDLAQSHWLTQRAIRFQNECFTESGVDEKRLALFLRYQTTHERSFHKALTILMKLKKERTHGFVSHSAQKQNPERSDGPLHPGFVPQNIAKLTSEAA